MSELRRAREQMGLSLKDVSEKLRIQEKWLDALERGDTDAFPAGPFLGGYTRQYRAFLGLGDTPSLPLAASETLPPPTTPRGSPRRERVLVPEGAEGPDLADTTSTSPRHRVSRMSRQGLYAALAASALLALFLLARGMSGGSEESLGVPPDQVLLVTSASGVGARVTADGRPVHEGKLTPGKQVKFAAHDRLEVELDELSGVTLVYNGNTLRPLGAQSRPRRIVFEDDRGG
ncbi:MAG: helix-turn-helix domain-containing protein [Deltaproteobacteria bacterium]|nr:helix-turn-helix domain-containing protein [Deltaproteobacteria bacterium]